MLVGGKEGGGCMTIGGLGEGGAQGRVLLELCVQTRGEGKVDSSLG
jgi:hypothetical protein